MNLLKRLAPLFILLITGAFNCMAGGIKDGYKTDPVTGVRYHFFKQDNNGKKPVMGDIVFVRLVYKRDDDSLLYNSHKAGLPDSIDVLPLTLKSVFQGSLEQGITMMAAGDSASFLVSADSIYYKVFKLKSLPRSIKPGSDLKFYVKLVRFDTPDELKAHEYAMVENHRTELQKMQQAEADSIRRYLAAKNITVKPVMIDSLYILQRTGKPGRPIEEGDSVEIKYMGMLLDGTVFDQSDNGDGTNKATKLLYRHNAKLIKGWLDVLQTMHEGETVRFLLPSSLAYGYNGAGKNIKPYTPLLFEIKVLRVSSPFDK